MPQTGRSPTHRTPHLCPALPACRNARARPRAASQTEPKSKQLLKAKLRKRPSFEQDSPAPTRTATHARGGTHFGIQFPNAEVKLRLPRMLFPASFAIPANKSRRGMMDHSGHVGSRNIGSRRGNKKINPGPERSLVGEMQW